MKDVELAFYVLANPVKRGYLQTGMRASVYLAIFYSFAVEKSFCSCKSALSESVLKGSSVTSTSFVVALALIRFTFCHNLSILFCSPALQYPVSSICFQSFFYLKNHPNLFTDDI